MIARMSIPERAGIMRDLRDKLFAVYGEFEEILSEKFAPFDSRNYEGKYTAEDVCGNCNPYDDIDAPLIQGIVTALDKAYDGIETRCKELDEEEAARDEAKIMFYAWNLGLCPCVMREYRRNNTPHVRNFLNWDEVAGFLTGGGMSREKTEEAVRKYLRDKAPDSDRVIGATLETIREKKTA